MAARWSRHETDYSEFSQAMREGSSRQTDLLRDAPLGDGSQTRSAASFARVVISA